MIPGDALQPIVDELKALRAAVAKQPRMVWATVTATNPLRVRVDGDTGAMAAAPALATLTPRVGSRVYCVMQNGRCTVVGNPDDHGGGRGTNLIPGADSIGATGLYTAGSPPGFSAFGYNRTYGMVWAQANAAGTGPTLDTDMPFFLEKGVTYRFEVTAYASVANTRYYVQMWDPDSNTSIPGTRGDGVPASYVATNILAGASQGTALTHTLEWTPDNSSRAVLRFYTSHSDGASNPNGYQWFKDIRFVALESRAELDTMQDDITASRWHTTPLTSIGSFPAGSTVNEHEARYNDDWVWFMFQAEITPGNVGLLFSFNSDYRPSVRTLIPLAAGSSSALSNVYDNGNLHAQYPVQSNRQAYRVSGMFPRA